MNPKGNINGVEENESDNEEGRRESLSNQNDGDVVVEQETGSNGEQFYQTDQNDGDVVVEQKTGSNGEQFYQTDQNDGDVVVEQETGSNGEQFYQTAFSPNVSYKAVCRTIDLPVKLQVPNNINNGVILLHPGKDELVPSGKDYGNGTSVEIIIEQSGLRFRTSLPLNDLEPPNLPGI